MSADHTTPCDNYNKYTHTLGTISDDLKAS